MVSLCSFTALRLATPLTPSPRYVTLGFALHTTASVGYHDPLKYATICYGRLCVAQHTTRAVALLPQYTLLYTQWLDTNFNHGYLYSVKSDVAHRFTSNNNLKCSLKKIVEQLC